MTDDRGELDLEQQIENLKLKISGIEKVVEFSMEENSNLRVIISQLQEEKTNLQKELDNTLYQLQIKKNG